MALDNIPIWSFPPNWSEGITETLEWLTAILDSPNGAEQRMALRATPRRSFEMLFTRHGPIRTLFDMFIERVGGADIYVPLWYDPNRLTATAAAGTTYLELGTTLNAEFRDNPAIFIQGADPWNYEVAEKLGQIDIRLALSDPLVRTWPANTRIYPMQKCRVEIMPEASRKADRLYQVRVKFSSTNPNPSQTISGLNRYNGQFVLETEPNDIRDLAYSYQRIIEELDNQTGMRSRLQLNQWGSMVQQFTFYAHRRVAHETLRGFFYALQGRRYPVWVPTFFHDFDIVSNITAGSLTMDVKRCGFTDFGGPFRGREHILVHLRDKTRIYRKIISSALVGDGSVERITLSRTFQADITVEQIRRISFLALCRLDQDAVEIMHHTDTRGASTVTTVFRNVPQVRMPIPDPQAESVDERSDSEDGFIDDDIEPRIPPDRSLDGIDLNGGFGGQDWANIYGWDRENAVPSRLSTGILAPGSVDLPGYGSFAAYVHTSWHFTFGNGPANHPKIRVYITGLASPFAAESEAYSGPIVPGADEGYGGGGWISLAESTVEVPRTPIVTNPMTLCVAVDLDNKRISGRVNNSSWANFGGALPGDPTFGGDITSVVVGSVFPAWSNYAGSKATIRGDGFKYGIPAGFSGWGAGLAWDAANGNPDFVLSNSDTTVEGPIDGLWSSIRATIGHTTGKWYFELDGNTVDVSNGWMGGIENSSGTLTNYIGSTSNGAGFQSLGQLYRGGSVIGPNLVTQIVNTTVRLWIQVYTLGGSSNTYLFPPNSIAEQWAPPGGLLIEWWKT